MESLQNISNSQQYSNSNLNINNSNSTVSFKEIRSNLSDVIPDDDFMPFYISRYKKLGYKRFVELANKARAASNTPQKLFCWMLKNNELVK